jgi:hypothetical protein
MIYLSIEEVSELTGVKPEKVEEIADNSDEFLYVRKAGKKHYNLRSVAVVAKEIAKIGRAPVLVKKIVPRKLNSEYMSIAKEIHHLYNKANSYKKEDRKPARDKIKQKLREAFV